MNDNMNNLRLFDQVLIMPIAPTPTTHLFGDVDCPLEYGVVVSNPFTFSSSETKYYCFLIDIDNNIIVGNSFLPSSRLVKAEYLPGIILHGIFSDYLSQQAECHNSYFRAIETLKNHKNT